MKILTSLIVSLSFVGCTTTATVTKEDLTKVDTVNRSRLFELSKRVCMQEAAWCVLGSQGQDKGCEQYFRTCVGKSAQDLGLTPKKK